MWTLTFHQGSVAQIIFLLEMHVPLSYLGDMIHALRAHGLYWRGEWEAFLKYSTSSREEIAKIPTWVAEVGSVVK